MGHAQFIQLPLAQRISRCRHHIARWKRNNRSNAQECISILRAKLDKAVSDNNATQQEKTHLKEELDQAYIDEEVFWKQKSRIQWLRAGDRNTSFFHAITKGKRSRNTITSIQDEHGVIHRGQQSIGRVAQDYFTSFFSSSSTDPSVYDKVFSGFTKKVTAEINMDLTREVTIEEIQEAIFAIGPHRAPGPDGFSTVFYHQFWDELKTEIIQEVKQFFDTGEIDPALNHTNICLIPKVYPPTGMAEFRPIALCNVAYKVISKILVNRMKKHLAGLITENQQAFIPGRIITDNIIVAHEVFHSLKVRKRQASSYMAVKTDIAKAYDRLEWRFLEETMIRMGFDTRWIKWIMACVSSVSFSVLINGAP